MIHCEHEPRALAAGFHARQAAKTPASWLPDGATRFIVCMMALSVTIPDEIVAALKLPPRNVAEEIKKELAVQLAWDD